MTRDQVLDELRKRRPHLRSQGVVRAALFGSLARGEQREDSDIDIMVELDPSIVVTIYDYAGVKQFIAEMFEQPVDVVSLEGLRPNARSSAIRDAIYAF